MTSLRALLRSMMKMKSLKVPLLREKAGDQSKNNRAKIAFPTFADNIVTACRYAYS
ncbi:hypothetical protein ANAPH2_01445 [Anaplasma phagocytophilum]|nr:hypothetical protein ANAPH2_01445 [Anaplasma phagocytophilum]